MEFECRSSMLTLMLCARLLGKIECNAASKEESELFRIVVPLLKLYTGKQVEEKKRRVYVSNKCWPVKISDLIDTFIANVIIRSISHHTSIKYDKKVAF